MLGLAQKGGGVFAQLRIGRAGADPSTIEAPRIGMGQALAAADGNQTAAAELIKMSLRTFQAKAKVYGLRPKDRR